MQIRMWVLGSLVVIPFVGIGQEVGIGTTTPLAQLHIEASAGYVNPLLIVNVNGLSNPYLIITREGKVGINIAIPSEVLDVNGNISFTGALMPSGSAGTSGQVLVSQGPGSPPQWMTIGGSGGVAGICNTQISNYVQKWTGTELCNSVIYDDGLNVGIGTSTPTSKLHIAGNDTLLRLESFTSEVWIRFQNQNSSIQGEYIGAVDSNIV